MPDCDSEDMDEPVWVAIHLVLKKDGGMEAVNDIFPIEDTTFRLDRTGPLTSYWNAKAQIRGKTVLMNGYCVDVEHTIGSA